MSPRALKLLAALSMLAALTGVVVIAGVTQLNAYLVRPGPAREETVVVLPRGAGLARIAALLNNAGVIEHPWMFRMAARVLGRDRALKAGEYAFPAAITPASVLNLMASGQTVAHRLTVAEGLTVAEIYQLLDKADGLVGELPPAPPEGSLLPETYFYALGDSRADLVKRMQRGMQDALAELWPQRARGLPITRREDAVTLASIVDKETGQADERRKVAAVFINRLRRGMRLQADPTVIYGLTEGEGRLGRALTRNDWADGSAYNTYQIDGLPPGPIANPGPRLDRGGAQSGAGRLSLLRRQRQRRPRLRAHPRRAQPERRRLAQDGGRRRRPGAAAAQAETGDRGPAQGADRIGAQAGDRTRPEAGDRIHREAGGGAHPEARDRVRREARNRARAEAGDQARAEAGDQARAEVGDRAAPKPETGPAPKPETGPVPNRRPGSRRRRPSPHPGPRTEAAHSLGGTRASQRSASAGGRAASRRTPQ